MNQKQMQYFVTVYETQNIQVAADQLFVTRQGVSKVIRLLETELGQQQRGYANRLCRCAFASCQTIFRSMYRYQRASYSRRTIT